ncbi:extracellular calcium-sensing receptor-like isoform X2 [Hyperolius riggenbachi]
MAAPNYSCMGHGTVAGFIGDLQSTTTLRIAQLLSLYKYTLVSHGARDTLLSDRRLFPHFFRTVPDNQIHYKATVKLLETFKWNWVGIVTSDDEYGERELQQLSKHLANHGICIEFKILVSYDNFRNIPHEFQTSVTDVIIICGTFSRIFTAFLGNSFSYHERKTFIFPPYWSWDTDFLYCSNCSLAFSSEKFSVYGMVEFFHSYLANSSRNDPLQEDFLITYQQCLSDNQHKNTLIQMTTGRPLHNCTKKVNLITLLISTDSTQDRVYLAVDMMVRALDNVYRSLHKNGKKDRWEMEKHKYKTKVNI